MKPELGDLALLKHFGVKGMKWGVRGKKDRINSQDRTIKKGTTLQNISSREFKLSRRHVYAAYTNYDKDSYVNLMGNYHYDKSFKNEMVVKKDIKVPSDKRLVKEFTALVKSNPKQVAKDMTDAYNDVNDFWKKDISHFEKKISKIDDKYSKKGEELTREFIKVMVSDKSSETRAKFFGNLIKKGYDGMSDANDRDVWGGAHDPIIVFSPKKVIGDVKSIPLTNDDLKRYFDKVTFDTKFQKLNKDLSEIQR